MNLDPAIIRQQLANLFLLHPDLKDDDEAWALSVESETDAVELLRSIERRRQEALHLAGCIASNIAELQLRQERFERREKAMRELAFKLMSFADLKKLEMPEATYSIRNGQQKLIGDVNAEDMPYPYKRVKHELDRTAIKDALKEGIKVKGFELSNAEPSLSIRTK